MRPKWPKLGSVARELVSSAVLVRVCVHCSQGSFYLESIVIVCSSSFLPVSSEAESCDSGRSWETYLHFCNIIIQEF